MTCRRPKTSSQGFPLVDPHPASLFLPLSFCLTKCSLHGTVLEVQLYCLWRQQQYFPSLFSVFRYPPCHRRGQLWSGWADGGKASPNKEPSQMPLVSDSCHLPPTLTKPTLPFLHGKLHGAAALTKWEVQRAITSHLSSSKTPELQPTKQQSQVLSLLSMKHHQLQARFT